MCPGFILVTVRTKGIANERPHLLRSEADSRHFLTTSENTALELVLLRLGVKRVLWGRDGT